MPPSYHNGCKACFDRVSQTNSKFRVFQKKIPWAKQIQCQVSLYFQKNSTDRFFGLAFLETARKRHQGMYPRRGFKDKHRRFRATLHRILLASHLIFGSTFCDERVPASGVIFPACVAPSYKQPGRWKKSALRRHPRKSVLARAARSLVAPVCRPQQRPLR